MEYTVIGHGEEVREGSIHDFVKELPGLFEEGGFMLPLIVLNDFLMSGELNMGMSGIYRWKPFSIDEDEYRAMVVELQSSLKCSVCVPPEWIRNYADWNIWQLEIAIGVPSDEHRRLSASISDLESKMYGAHHEGDTVKSRYYEVLMGETETELAELINSHSKAK